VKIRLSQGPTVQKKARKNQRLALAFAALLTPAALMAGVLCIWRIGADLGFTGSFAISEGIFSRWQVWFAIAGAVEGLAILLTRYGRADAALTQERAHTLSKS